MANAKLKIFALPLLCLAASSLAARAETASVVPPPAVPGAAATSGTQTVVLAGGCFWGVQAVFQHVKGVKLAVSGYTGGTKASPNYEEVSTGATGHAESVKVEFDPRQISYGQILQIYFSVVQDPTELNFQGPDEGTQYRSDIFYDNANQKTVAESYIAQLNQAAAFKKPIVTRVDALAQFYPAEAYHQNYAVRHPDNGYIVENDLPKVENLKRLFPALYREKPEGLVAASL